MGKLLLCQKEGFAADVSWLLHLKGIYFLFDSSDIRL
jgi:hypothetical protein